MDHLTAMGFSTTAAENALRLFDGDVGAAVDMLLNSLPAAGDRAANAGETDSQEIDSDVEIVNEQTNPQVGTLMAMGFDAIAAKNALDAAAGNLERAADVLLTGGTEMVEVAAPSRRAILAGSSPHGRRIEYTDDVEREAKKAKKARTGQDMSIEGFAKRVTFGPAAFTRPPDRASPTAPDSSLRSMVASIVLASVPEARGKRTTRGEKSVAQAMTECYTIGLHTHGPAVNNEVVPAFQYIIFEMSKLDPKDPKRVNSIRVLTEAFEDCQQVQAREILRMFGDLTSQNASLESQLKYSLVRLKEAAVNRYITQKHPKCDLDHRRVQPHQQRAHLFSAYICLLANTLGLDTVEAKHDRFLSLAQSEVGCIDINEVMVKLREDMPIKEWLQILLADINNQSPEADRLIDRDCVFSWVQANMSQESGYTLFYDEDRADEFIDHDPKAPHPENKFQPFLSCKVLVDILLAASMIKWNA